MHANVTPPLNLSNHYRHSVGDKYTGFTLIEMSIVIVVIGLIVGGVLVGKDLIKGAEIRAQVSQIQKFRTATNTFKLKYGYLPGDIPNTDALAFGLKARMLVANKGNGIISGYWSTIEDEGSLFWSDLGDTGMIEGKFLGVTVAWQACQNGGAIKNYIPPAKLGNNMYVYVMYDGVVPGNGGEWADINRNKNYFGIGYVSEVSGFSGGAAGCPGGDFDAYDGLTAIDAYNIDTKIDDGLPQSGKSIAKRHNGGWSLWSGNYPANRGCPPANGWACPAGATSCYDDGGVTNGARKYSVGYNGSNPACGLWFEFQ